MIREMTTEEIKKALHRAAEVCIENQRTDWWSIDVCRADGSFQVANDDTSEAWDVDYIPDNAAHAAAFLLFVAESYEG